MTPAEAEEEVGKFLADGERLHVYNEARRQLSAIGLETLLRRLGEPLRVALDHPLHNQVAAIDAAERRGWYMAIDHVFNLAGTVERKSPNAPSLDFGAEAALEKMGYKNRTEEF